LWRKSKDIIKVTGGVSAKIEASSLLYGDVYKCGTGPLEKLYNT
jgi:hypothetical protein